MKINVRLSVLAVAIFIAAGQQHHASAQGHRLFPDLNGDGRTDIALYKPDGSWGSTPVLMSRGDGSWTAVNAQTPSWANQPGVKAIYGDFNGDRRTDVAFHRPSGPWGTVPVLLAQGDGSWTAINTSAPSWAHQPGVVAIPGDFNHDGRTDIAFHRPGGPWGTVPVLFALDNGTWQSTNLAAPGWANEPNAVAIPGDYNRDGRTDIAFHRPGGSWTMVPVLLSQGNGAWTVRSMSAPSWAHQENVIAIPGDFNGDGRADIAFHRPDGGWASVPILFARGDGSWNSTNHSAPSWANRAGGAVAIAGRFNDDAITDIAFYRPAGSWATVPVIFGRGDGTWANTNQTVPNWANQPGTVALPGNFNGDALTDIAFIQPGGDGNTVPVIFACGDGNWNATDNSAPDWAAQPGVMAVNDSPLNLAVKKRMVWLPGYRAPQIVSYRRMIEGKYLIEGDVLADPAWTPARKYARAEPDVRGDIGVSVSALSSISAAHLWPMGIIPYEVSEAFSRAECQTIERSVRDLGQMTNLTFVPRVNDPDYISFRKTDDGCHTSTGWHGGRHRIFLEPMTPGGGTCLTDGVIKHEILHAAGFHHEQIREDRDNFVTILWDNIQEDKLHNFELKTGETINRTSYDFSSVMHYRSTAFGKMNGAGTTLQTIAPKVSGVLVSSLGGANLSMQDVQGVNDAYALVIPNDPLIASGQQLSIIETTYDRCRDTSFTLGSTFIPKGDTVGQLLPLNSNRFSWRCGSTQEWTTCRAGTTHVKVSRDQDGRIQWDCISNAPEPGARFLNTEIDRCGSSRLEIDTVTGRQSIQDRVPTFVEVADRRIKWFCGGTREWATLPPETRLVRVVWDRNNNPSDRVAELHQGCHQRLQLSGIEGPLVTASGARRSSWGHRAGIIHS